MSTFLRFRLGPLVSYQRLGRTKAQKRAAAKAHAARSAARRSARDERRRTDAVEGVVVGFEDSQVLVQVHESGCFSRILKVPASDWLPEGQMVEVRYRHIQTELLAGHPDDGFPGHLWFEVPKASVKPASPEAQARIAEKVAARERSLDWWARNYTGWVEEFKRRPDGGTTLLIRADGRDDLTVDLAPGEKVRWDDGRPFTVRTGSWLRVAIDPDGQPAICHEPPE